jgi:peptide/nickel transport system substrate-binding protein
MEGNMNESYWDKVLGRRAGRRRVLAGTGAALAGATLLVACGDDDAPATSPAGTGGTTGAGPATGPAASTGAGSTGPSETGGLMSEIVDDTPNLKRGGMIKSRSTLEHVTLDPMVGGGHVGQLVMTYSSLFRTEAGYKQQTNGEIVGDLAQSWELSDDRLQLTVKLHPEAHFAPVSPVDGRAVDAEDIVFSWQRFEADGRGRLELAHSASPSAPVLSVEATDSSTVVFKLQQPHSALLALLGLPIAGSFWIMPRESDGGFDIRRQPIGSGPFYQSNFEPSVSYEMKANPGFGQDDRDLPYVDGINMPIVSETATAMSQFRAGEIWTTVVPPSEILAVKSDIPDLNLFDSGLVHAFIRVMFGHLPESQFIDERMRQAWVYTWNRDEFLDAIYDLPTYTAQGIPVRKTWDQSLWGDSYAGWWLDPQGSDFGENAKYLRQNLEEAKALTVAAGYPDGVDATFVHTEGYMGSWQDQFQILHGFAINSGIFNVEIKESSYAAGEYQKEYRDARGQYTGVSARGDSAPVDPTLHLVGHYNTAGAQFQGNDETLEDLTNKMLLEFDTAARQELGHEIQRWEAKASHFPLVGSASIFELWWPVLRNVFVFQGGSHRDNATLFIDDTKPPVA